MNVLLGFDPGGAGAFGWCVAEHSPELPIRVLRTGIANHAEDAVAAARRKLSPADSVIGAGIGAPLFWTAAGDRRSDQLIRTQILALGAQPGSVQHVSSLQGACLVQGMLAAMLLRDLYPALPLSESHPKAFLCSPALLPTRRRLAQLHSAICLGCLLRTAAQSRTTSETLPLLLFRLGPCSHTQPIGLSFIVLSYILTLHSLNRLNTGFQAQPTSPNNLRCSELRSRSLMRGQRAIVELFHMIRIGTSSWQILNSCGIGIHLWRPQHKDPIRASWRTNRKRRKRPATSPIP